MTVLSTRLTMFLLFSSIVSIATSQQAGQLGDSNSKVTEYKIGQVWKTDTGITVTILVIESLPRLGKVVHVRVDKVPVQSCGGVQLTTTIEHVAFTDNAMKKSAMSLANENVDLPDSYLDAYRKWEKQKKHEATKLPIPEVIRSVSTLPGPMICN